MEKKYNIEKMWDNLMKKRWLITLIVLLTFFSIVIGIGIAVMFNSDVNEKWEKLLMLLLGAFIGSYSKIMDYWFNDANKDKMFIEKIDDDNDDEDSSNQNSKKQKKVSEKPTNL